LKLQYCQKKRERERELEVKMMLTMQVRIKWMEPWSYGEKIVMQARD
jgi:hypothetical protein